MKIVWDEPKRLANIASHGMDFADLDDAFFEGSVIVLANSGRLIAVGRHRGESKGTEIDRWLGSKTRSSRGKAIPGRIGTTFKAPN